MKAILIGTVDNVNGYEGKKGYGANITMSSVENKKRESVTFTIKDESLADQFEGSLQEEGTVEIILTQNNFGLRFGEVLSFTPNN